MLDVLVDGFHGIFVFVGSILHGGPIEFHDWCNKEGTHFSY